MNLVETELKIKQMAMPMFECKAAVEYWYAHQVLPMCATASDLVSRGQVDVVTEHVRFLLLGGVVELEKNDVRLWRRAKP